MNNSNHKETLRYYSSHKSEARELAAILIEAIGEKPVGQEECKRATVQPITASEAGKLIGMSAQFVKDNIGKIFTSGRKSLKGRKEWHFDAVEIIESYSYYLNNN